MTVQKIDIEKVKKLTESIYCAFCIGSTEPWLSLFCNDSIYVGNDGQFFFGADAICDHFKGFGGRSSKMSGEDYYVVPLSDKLALSYGRFATGGKRADIKLPVPSLSYMKVKEDLNNYFTGIVCDD